MRQKKKDFTRNSAIFVKFQALTLGVDFVLPLSQEEQQESEGGSARRLKFDT